MEDIGSYVKFSSECYHKGFKSGTDYTNLSAQLFAAPKGNRQEKAAATLINNKLAFRKGKLEGEQLEILRAISKHIQENWDDPKIYMKKAYDPPKCTSLDLQWVTCTKHVQRPYRQAEC